jgi:hypothetical protein
MKNLIPVLLTICIILTSCIANKYSYKRKGEEVHLAVQHYHDRVAEKPLLSVLTADETKSRGLGAIMALPYVFKMGYNQVEKMISNEDKKRSAEYSGVTSDDKFYMSTAKDATVNVDKITLCRTIQKNKKCRDTALVAVFGLEKSSDGSFLRLVPERLKVGYCKAKLAMGDKNVDLEMNISLNTFWIDNDKTYKSESIGPLNVILYNVPLRKELSKEKLADYATPWFSVIPRSHLDDNAFGTGNYALRITVKEYDEYGTNRITFNERFNYDSNREDAKGAINDVSNQIKMKQEQKQLQNNQ